MKRQTESIEGKEVVLNRACYGYEIGTVCIVEIDDLTDEPRLRLPDGRTRWISVEHFDLVTDIQYGVEYTVLTKSAGARAGDIVMLREDDGSAHKFYINLTTAGHRADACIASDKLVPSEDYVATTPPPEKVTKAEQGIVYVVNIGDCFSRYYDDGDLLVLESDDGSLAPWFHNLSRPEQSHRIAVGLNTIEVYTGTLKA